MFLKRSTLRKIILENLLKEEATATASGAKKSKAASDSETQEAILSDAEAFVEAVVQPLVASFEYFTAKINIGKVIINSSGVSGRGDDGIDVSRADIRDLKKSIKAALKDNADIAALRKKLKIGRRVKVNYEQKGTGEPAATASDELDPDAPSPEPDDSPGPKKNCAAVLDELRPSLELAGDNGSGEAVPGATVSNGFVFKANSPYLYYVSTANGCWYALNKNNCKFFSMKKYPDNMDNLDKKFPDARDAELKNRCAGKTAVPKDQAPPAKPGNLDISEQAIIYLMAAGTGNNFDTLGPQLVMQYKRRKDSAFKEVISQVKRTSDFRTLTKAAMAFVIPKSVGGLLDLSDVDSAGLNTPDAFNGYAKKNGMGKALKLVLNQGAAFDLRGFDEVPNNRELMPELKDALGKYFSAPGNTLNESFGKSRGTLLRERYWGRY